VTTPSVGRSGSSPRPQLGGRGQARAFDLKDLRRATRSPRERFGRAGRRYPHRDPPYAVSAPPESGETWAVGVMIVVGLLLAAFLFADEQWRSRWLPRRPR
jgi:hypothetical protein